MTRRLIGCLTLIALAVAPATAEKLYIPYAMDRTVDGVVYETQIWATNDDPAPHSLTATFTPSGQSATKAAAGERTVGVSPGTTNLLVGLTPEQAIGMLELDVFSSLVIGAQIVATLPNGAQTLGTHVPAISRENAGDPGTVLHLQGLRRDTDHVTDFGLVNLGQTEASCSIDVVTSSGASIAADIPVTLPPLALINVDRALQLLGLSPISGVRAAVGCDQPFYAYSVVRNLKTGEVHFSEPSATGASGFTEGGGPSVPGAFVYTRDGVFHTPTRANPKLRFDIPMPGGTPFSVIKVDIDVTFTGWFQAFPQGQHHIYSLLLDCEWGGAAIGYINVRGPSRNKLQMHTNATRHPKDHWMDATDQNGWTMDEGHTYRFEYTYDTTNVVRRLVVTDLTTGEVVGDLQDQIVRNVVQAQSTPGFCMGIGHLADEPGPEVPTYGWRYANLRFEAIP